MGRIQTDHKSLLIVELFSGKTCLNGKSSFLPMVMRLFYFAVSIFLMEGCTSGKNRYDPDHYLNGREKDVLMSKIIRYTAKPPKKVADSLKFSKAHEAYYNQQMARHQLIAFHCNRNGEQFFLITRPAPSLTPKYVATGGKLKMDEQGNLLEYEEVFRTWKLQYDTLRSRALYLFDLMVKGESLKPYYTKTAGFHYIEFPDDNVYFDKATREWRSKRIRSVEEYVKDEIESNGL
jgi:hypothetical protein